MLKNFKLSLSLLLLVLIFTGCEEKPYVCSSEEIKIAINSYKSDFPESKCARELQRFVDNKNRSNANRVSSCFESAYHTSAMSGAKIAQREAKKHVWFQTLLLANMNNTPIIKSDKNEKSCIVKLNDINNNKGLIEFSNKINFHRKLKLIEKKIILE